MKRLREFAVCLLCGAMLGAMLARPEDSLRAAVDALSTYAEKVLPALMPQLFLMLLLSSRVPPSGATLVPMAWLCGSPGGARLAAREGMGKQYAMRLCAMTGTMSPGFFLGTLGALTKNQRAAQGMLICHLLSALLTGLFFRGKAEERAALPSPMSLSDAAGETARAMLSVAVLMTLGSILASLAEILLPLPNGLLTALAAMIEVTSGGVRLSILDSPFKMPLLCAACSFGGLSVILQTAVYWRRVGLSVPRIALIRLTHATLAFLLCFLLSGVLKL